MDFTSTICICSMKQSNLSVTLTMERKDSILKKSVTLNRNGFPLFEELTIDELVNISSNVADDIVFNSYERYVDLYGDNSIQSFIKSAYQVNLKS